MKMVKSLTATNGKAYGIERAKQHDFRDDGSSFRGYEYKGIPLTQCVYEGTTYLSIRVDYLKNNFTSKDWIETEEWKLEDEFNGVGMVDLDKLVENLERIIAKRDEMNRNATVDKQELEAARQKAQQEIEDIEKRLEAVKNSSKGWWELSEYELKSAKDYMKSLVRNIENRKKEVAEIYNETVRRQRYFIQTKSGLGTFYIEQLEKYFGIEA